CTKEWLPPPAAFIPTTGAGNRPLCSVLWDPDGAGPLREQLVVGGQFTTIGGTTANRIARWDGMAWYPLGSGMNDQVFGLAVFNGELIATGLFTTAGGVACSRIARYNGTTWQPLLGGLNDSGSDMVVWNNALYVCGSFTQVNGFSANRVARWSGTSWSPMHLGMSNQVSAIEVFNNELYAAGWFAMASGTAVSRIARWTGSTWAPLGTGISGGTSPAVYELCAFDGNLWVGGEFTNAGGVSTNNLARWNGFSWSGVGTGMTNSSGGFAYVSSLSTHGFDKLVIGGNFNRANGMPVTNLAMYSGSTAVLSDMGKPFPNPPGGGPDTTITFEDNLFVGGFFDTPLGGADNNMALWGGGTGPRAWGPLNSGFTGPIYALLGGSGLIAGGEFKLRTDASTIADNVVAVGTTGYGTLSTLTGFTGTGGAVRALGSWNPSPVTIGYTIVGGDFINAAGIAVNRIASYRLSTWAAMGAGFNDSVLDVQQFGTTLYATGRFTASGATSVSRIARFVSGAWQPVSTGLSGDGYAMTLYNGELVVGGSFSSAGGVAVPNVARWNNTAWQPLGTGSISGVVAALATFGTDLVAAGSFQSFGQTPQLKTAMRWNGTAWQPMDAGLPALGQGFFVAALAVHDGELYLGGGFSVTDGGPGDGTFNSQVYRWTGSSWVPAVGSMSGSVYALASSSGSLWAGGSFTNASGNPAPYLTRLDCFCYANCDNSVTSPVLNVNDFVCFQNQFAAGSAYANCDRSTIVPVLNINDFICFQNKFAAGCP
ncbi:MAG: hypothetical protein ACKVW3_15525, partial [Phycisphaerales bacterium]